MMLRTRVKVFFIKLGNTSLIIASIISKLRTKIKVILVEEWQCSKTIPETLRLRFSHFS